jgi:Raffinose synthase or seed imbibition protein Sip1
VAVGDNFESANAAVMYQARALAMTSQESTNQHNAELAALGDDVKAEWYENWYDGLGYCECGGRGFPLSGKLVLTQVSLGTWNALGQKLTEEKVLKAVDTLAENSINISTLIIDDNWQDIDYKGDSQWKHGWRDFEAEPKTFPKGLKSLVSEIRSRHKGIQNIAVWHTLLGYWAGLSPDGPLSKRYKTVELIREDVEDRNLPLGGKMTVVAEEDVNKLYDDFYRFLSDCGVDGVKTDAQYMMDTWVSAKARRELINTYLDAWTIASLRHFGSRAISCMSQSPQIMFHSQLPRNRPAVLCRNSDDFIPDIPSTHPWHIWSNAHNSLLTQHLNILPDWDMFQTDHGQHDIDLINQMTGTTPRGKTVIFRPSVLGRAIDQYINYDDLSLLKVGAYHGRAVTGTPIMGVFNISTRPLTEILPLSRFSGVLPSSHYVVRSHRSGKVTAPLQTSSPASLLTLSLGVGDYDILCAFPLSVFDTETRGRVLLTNLGLVGKMTGCAAILNSRFELLDTGRVFIDTILKALGVLGKSGGSCQVLRRNRN